MVLGASVGRQACSVSDLDPAGRPAKIVQAYFVIITGRVQGVGFRWFTEREAQKLNVTGHVRNLPDGGVEVFAQGEAPGLGAFLARLEAGPSSSRVDEIDVKPVEIDPQVSRFEVKF